MKIIFMGTPEFAVASLEQLLLNKYNVIAVVTAVDKFAGRGMHLQKSAVKIFAEQHNIPILQPLNLKAPVFIEQLKSLNADVQIVVAFRMLPEVVWNMPPLGTINVHGSLLPKYRGAAPVHWTIINGEKESGVSTFKLKHKIDTGNILLQKKTQIIENETTGELYNRLKILGAEVLIETLDAIKTDNIIEIEQSNSADTFKHAPKILKSDCKIDWHKNGLQIKNLVRGLCPIPTAFFIHKGKNIKVYKVDFVVEKHPQAVGVLTTDNHTFIKISCTDGFVFLQELQMEGKKKMLVFEFLKGNKNI